METMNENHLQHITPIAQEDAAGLLKAHESYGNSWKKRGGIGVYMIMIRKFDRMELTCEKFGYDIFEAAKRDPRAEGIIDDIRDLRRYLNLIEAELRNRGTVTSKMAHRDNAEPATGVNKMIDRELDIIVNDAKSAKNACDGCKDRNTVHCDPDCDRKRGKIKEQHIPNGSCACIRCKTMKALANTTHPGGCECVECVQLRRSLVNNPKCLDGGSKY